MSQKMSDHIREAVAADLKRDFWYRPGEATFNPSLPHMREPNAIADYILSGWMPEAPFISPEQRVTFIGCCFGSALLRHLETADWSEPGVLDSQFIPISETLATSFAMRQMFEWEFDGVKPDPSLLKGNRALEINFSDDLWKGTLKRLSETDVFILMMSTAEVWYDEPSGAVVWREVPGANPARQKFRTTAVAENEQNIRTIHDVIRRHRPDAKVIFMLSPIPMIATHRKEACIVANTVSKAVMRAALDQAWRCLHQDGRFFYCPFYEVIHEGFGASPYGGHYNGDRRHINDAALDYLMRLFEAYYCRVKTLSRPLLSSYVMAKVSAGDLPTSFLDLAASKDRREMQSQIYKYQDLDDEPMARFTEAYASESLNLPVRTDEGGYLPQTTAWFSLPNVAKLGDSPLVLTMPAQAWAYGSMSQAFQAPEGQDLFVRVRLQALTGSVGIFMGRADGSVLSGNDIPVHPEDGPTAVDLPIYPSDGPGHLIVRNFNSEGVACKVRVQEVSVQLASMSAPARRMAAAPR